MTKEINKLWLVVNLATDEVEKTFVLKTAAMCWKQMNDINEPDATGIYCVVEFNQKGNE